MNQHTAWISSGSSAAVYIWHVSAGAAVPGTSAATIAVAITVVMSVSCISLTTWDVPEVYTVTSNVLEMGVNGGE